MVRNLEPVVTALDEEVRLSVVEVSGRKRLRLTSVSKGSAKWYEHGTVEVPYELLAVLGARLRAAVTDSRDLVA